MIIIGSIVAVICVLSVLGERRNLPNIQTCSFEKYLSLDVASSVKGVFIIVVFFRHVYPYLLNAGYCPNYLDDMFQKVDWQFQQLLVVMFLFYSGFGVCESLKNKGVAYIKLFPERRILYTLLNFDVAVLTFAIVTISVGENINLSKLLLSLLAWDSVGNSNWYIFCILYCYASTYIGVSLSKSNKYQLFGWMVVLSFVYIIALSYFKSGQTWWYNTILAYPLGMFWSVHRAYIEKVITKIGWWKSIIIATVVFTPIHFVSRDIIAILSNLQAVAFAIIILLLTMRIQFRSKMLIWLGQNLFPLYIYQRVPMILLSYYDNGEFILRHPYIYVLLCGILTLPFVYLFKLTDTRCVVKYLKGYVAKA